MLQILLSEWLVRVFLLYLLVVGCAAIVRRERPDLALPFDLLCLPIIRERWAGRRDWCAISAVPWWNKYGVRVGYVEQRELRLWKKSNGNGLRYA
jgi:hypothetical protein